MSTKTTNTVLENKVATLENRVNGAEDTITTMRNRIGELSDESESLKSDLELTKTMIVQDLETMMEQIGKRLNKK